MEIGNAYPNPFVHITTIDYSLFVDQDIDISIYNFLGQKVKTILSGNMKRGTYSVTWDGTGNECEQPSGVYLLLITRADIRLLKQLRKYFDSLRTCLNFARQNNYSCFLGKLVVQ